MQKLLSREGRHALVPCLWHRWLVKATLCLQTGMALKALTAALS